MKKSICLSLFFFAMAFLRAQHPAFAAAPGFRNSGPANAPFSVPGDQGWVQTKNYPLLSLLGSDPAVGALLEGDDTLRQLAAGQLARLRSVRSRRTFAGIVYACSFSDTAVTIAGRRLEAMLRPGNALDVAAGKALASGMYYRYNDSAAGVRLRKAWEQDAAGINFVVGVYTSSRKPNYPAIDSASIGNDDIAALADSLTQSATASGSRLFFSPPLQAAGLLLRMNGRTEAGDFEPMRLTVNRAPADAVPGSVWSAFPYTLLLVPGAGPDDANTALSPMGKMRCRLAVEQFRNKMAPFIMVSGGRVHPYKTKYSEAVEMKKFLLDSLAVPPSAVFVEPHARHTTTNMRNAARLMVRYGFPLDRPALVVTDPFQTLGIGVMASRCLKELGYLPYRLGRKISPSAVEFYPLPAALQVNPFEPLDP